MDEVSIVAYIFIAFLSTYSFHRYYTKRIGLNKIKSYLDNRELSIQEKCDNKLRYLEDATINFDVDLKKYQQFSRIVTSELAQIEKKIFLFEEIDSRLNGRIREYSEQKEAMDKVVADLKDKIDYFKSNEAMFHRLRNDLSDSTNRLEKLDKHLIQLEKQYEDRLSQKVGEYALAVDEDLGRLRKSLENKLEEHENIMYKKSSGIKQEFDILLKEWTNMREQSERIFKEEQEHLFDTVKSEADAFYDEEKKEIRTLLDEIRNDLENSSGEIDLKLGELEDRQGRLLDKSVKLEEDIEKNRQVILDRTSDVSEEILKQLKQNVKDYQKELVDELSDKQSFLSKEIERLKKSLGDTETEVIEEVNQQFSNIQQSVKEYEQRLSKQVEQSEVQYNQLREKYFDSSEQELKELQNGFDKLLGIKNELLREQANEKDMHTAHADFMKGRREAVEDWEVGFKRELKDKTESLQSHLEVSFNNLNELAVNSKEELLEYKKDLMTSLNAELTREFKVETGNIKKDLDRIKTKRDEKLKEFYNHLNENKVKLLKDFEKRLTKIDDKYRHGLSDLKQKSEQANEKLIDFDKIKQGMLETENNIRVEMSLVKDGFKNELADFKKGIEEERREIKNNQSNRFIELSEEIKSDQKELFDSIKIETDVFLSKEIEKLKKSLGDTETEVIEEVNQQFSNIQQSVKEYEQRLSKQVEQSEVQYNQLREKYFDSSEQELKELQNGFDKLLGIKNELLREQANEKDMHTAHADFMKGRREAVEDWEVGFKRELKDKTESLQSHLEVSFNNLNELAVNSKEELSEYKKELTASLNDELTREFKVETGNIKKDLDRIKTKRDEKLKEFYNHLNENKVKLLKDFEKRLTKIDDKYRHGLSDLKQKSEQANEKLIDFDKIKQGMLETENNIRVEMSLVKDGFKNELADFKKGIEEERKEIKNNQSNRFIELSEEIKSDQKELFDSIKIETDVFLSKEIEKLKKSLGDTETEVIEEVNQQFSNIQQSVKEYEQRLSKQVEQSEVQYNQLREKYFDSSEQELKELQNGFDKLLGIKNELLREQANEKDMHTAHADFMKGRREAVEDWEVGFKRELKDKTESLQSHLEVSFNNLNELAVNSKEELSEYKKELMASLNAELTREFKVETGNIKKDLDRIKTKRDEKLEEFYNHLNENKSQLLKDFEKRLTKIDDKYQHGLSDLKQKSEQANEKLIDFDKIKQGMLETEGEVRSDMSLIKGNFNHELNEFKKEIEEDRKESKKNQGRHLVELSKEMSTQVEKIKSGLGESIEFIKQEADEKLREHLRRIDSEVKDSNTFFADMSGKINLDIKKSFVEFKEKFNKKLVSFDREVEKSNVKLSDHFNKLDKATGHYVLDLEKKATQYENKLEKSFGDLDKDNQKKINELINGIKNDNKKQTSLISKNEFLLKQIKSNFEQKLLNLNKKYENMYEKNVVKVKDILSMCQKLKKDFGDNLETYLSSQAKSVSSKVTSEMESSFTSFKKQLEQKFYSLNQEADDLNVKNDKNFSNLEKQTKEHKVILEKKFTALNTKLEKSWENLDKNNSKKISELVKEVKNDNQKHILLISKSADSLSEAKNNFNKELINLSKKYNDLHQENLNKVENVVSVCDKLKKEFSVDLDNHLSHQIKEVSGNLKSFKNSMQISFATIEKDMEVKIKERVYQLESEVNGSNKFFADMNEKVNKKLENSFISFKKEFDKKLHFLSQDLDKINIKKDKQLTKLDKIAENHAHVLDKKLSELSKKLEKNWESLDKDNDKKIADLIKEIKSDYQNQALLISKNTGFLNKIKLEFEKKLFSLNEKYNELYKENTIKVESLIHSGEKLKENVDLELKDYFSQQKRNISNDLESFKHSFAQSLNKDEKAISKKVDDWIDKINLSDHEVSKVLQKNRLELDEIKNSAKDVEQQLDEKIKKIAEHYNAEMGIFFKNKENAFSNEWVKIEKSLETKEKELSQKTEKHFVDFNGRIEKISAKMEKQTKHINLFKKIDVLSVRLANDLKMHSEKIDDLKNESKHFENINDKIKEMKHLVKESKSLLSFIHSEKDNVDFVSKNIKKLLNQCLKIDDTSNKMNGHLQSIEIFDKKIKEHMEMTQKVLEQVSAITKNKDNIEEISKWIINFEKKKKDLLLSYNSLDKKVELSAEKQLDINDKLNEIEDKALLIESNHKKILEFNNRYDNLEIALTDVEQRQKSIEKLKADLTVEKSSVLEIKNDLNDQIKKALSLRDDKIASTKKDGDKLNHDQTAEMVKALYAIGWNKEDIAKHLKKDIFEIDIYLKK